MGSRLTRILLVRHGQSTWNADGRWQGRADPPLSELGERQAEVAADKAVEFGITRIWASPLVRADQTARILSSRLGLEVENDVRLVERDAGDWTGKTRAEIEDGWPGFLDGGLRPNGFETDDVLHERAVAAMADIGRDAHEPVVVVSHGGLIRVVERALGSEPHSVPNLGGLDLRRLADGTLALSDRIVLIDAHAVTVTSPPEV